MATSDWVKRLVVPLADKVVYSSSAYVGLKSTINSLGEHLIDFSRPPTGPADERLHRLVRLIRPMTAPHLRLVRIGGDGDGGYVMADDFAVTGAISVGVGPDVSWDQGVAARGVSVAMFDPTVRRLPAPVGNGRFFKVGIGGPDAPAGYLPLPTLVRMAGFAPDAQLLLKVDVEGAEWTSFEAVTGDDLLPYRQMAFELHQLDGLHDPAQGALMLEVLATLTQHHVPIHVHANNYDGLVRFDENWFPNSIEVTYLRRDLIDGPTPVQSIANEHDRPCDPRVQEIPLEAIVDVE